MIWPRPKSYNAATLAGIGTRRITKMGYIRDVLGNRSPRTRFLGEVRRNYQPVDAQHHLLGPSSGFSPQRFCLPTILTSISPSRLAFRADPKIRRTDDTVASLVFGKLP